MSIGTRVSFMPRKAPAAALWVPSPVCRNAEIPSSEVAMPATATSLV